MSHRVAIVGAGVSGLTCGVLLQEHGYDVTVFYSDSEKSASPVAAAIWFPYRIGSEADSWALESYRAFEKLARDPRTGVSIVDFHVQGIALPAWALEIPHRLLTSGFILEVPLMETPVYLPWLREQLRIRPRTVTDLADLEREFDVVVNCSGLGARDLCGDPLVQSNRGVVLKVRNPGIACHMVALGANALTYILTRTDDVVLGGTDDWSTDTDVPPSVAREILERCVAIESRLPSEYEPAVGFRPARDPVRVEREPGRRIVHNYGHGGAGFTVSWGCAREVLELVQSVSRPG